jgi:CRISPR type III-A-associated RAMP protein Csm5
MKARLTTLTPVHIGNGTTYNKGIDFIQKDEKIGIVDEKKVLQLIGPEYIGQWVAAIERYNPDIHQNKQLLLELLKDRGFEDIRLDQISARISKLKSLNNRSTQLKEHYRAGLGVLTIPGSSMKGALKTMILDYLVGENRYSFNISDIKHERNYGRNEVKVDWKFDAVDKKLFGADATEKSTRFIQIGDVQFHGVHSVVHEIKILNRYEDDWGFKTGQHFLVETIPPGKTTEFQWKLNHDLLNANKQKYPALWKEEKIDFLKGSVNDFCSKIWNSSKNLIDWEINLLKEEEFNVAGESMKKLYRQISNLMEECADNEFIIRVGANSGWMFMTAGWWRGFNEELGDDYSKIRKVIQKKEYPEGMIWPKTRKISNEGYVLGFVKVALFD